MSQETPQDKPSILGIITVIHGAIFFVIFCLLAWIQLLHWSHTLPEIMSLTCSLGGGLIAFLQIVAGTLLVQKKAAAPSLVDGSAMGMVIVALIGIAHGMAFHFSIVDVLSLTGSVWPLAIKLILNATKK